MPRGYPDYFGQSIFPKYGSLKVATGSGISLPNGVEKTVVSISGKGQVYSGFMSISGTVSPVNTSCRVYVDNNLIFAQTIKNMLDHGFTLPDTTLLYVREYNTTNNYALIVVMKGITFEVNFVLKALATASATLSGSGNIYWYEIT